MLTLPAPLCNAHPPLPSRRRAVFHLAACGAVEDALAWLRLHARQSEAPVSQLRVHQRTLAVTLAVVLAVHWLPEELVRH